MLSVSWDGKLLVCQVCVKMYAVRTVLLIFVSYLFSRMCSPVGLNAHLCCARFDNILYRFSCINRNFVRLFFLAVLHCPTVSIINDMLLVTGRICRRQLWRYCFYSRPIFGFFAPQGRHIAPIKVKFGTEERILRAKFHLDQYRSEGLWPQNQKKFEFYQYNCP